VIIYPGIEFSDRNPLSLPEGQEIGARSQAVLVHQNLQEPKIDGYVFWDQNLCIVYDAYSRISPTDIDKIKHLSIIYIILYL
jgi:hypothetical protein